MKATTWLCPVFTLLCATKLVYTAQRESYSGYGLDDMDAQMIQNNDFRSKRNKPSLSIVNPLDVLRQRLLLEIARRQMKENSRQVELNRAILKNVGKRMVGKYSSPWTATLYDVNELQQRQQQQQQQHQQQMQQEFLQHLPNNYEYDLIPTTFIFDYIQKQQQQPYYSLPSYATNALQYDNSYINDVIDENINGQPDNSEENEVSDEVLAINNLLADNGLDDNQHSHSLDIYTQTNTKRSISTNEQQHKKDIFQKSISSPKDDNDKKHLALINNKKQQKTYYQNSPSIGSKNNLNLEPNVGNPIPSSSNQNANDSKNEMNVNGDDYQIQRYLYHLHKNHLTRK